MASGSFAGPTADVFTICLGPTCLTAPSFDTSPTIVIGDQLTEWTREGYRGLRARPIKGTVDVITPPSTVAALRAGYRVQIDASARG